jgi:hypothetical protein
MLTRPRCEGLLEGTAFAVMRRALKKIAQLIDQAPCARRVRAKGGGVMLRALLIFAAIAVFALGVWGVQHVASRPYDMRKTWSENYWPGYFGILAVSGAAGVSCLVLLSIAASQ